MDTADSHWTERSIKDFLYKIASDFTDQLEDKMESISLSQDELAKRLNVSKSRVSQVLNNPGNITLKKIIEYSRAVGLKVSIVAYDDNDPDNQKGPINSKVFYICWKKLGMPKDFWDLDRKKIKTPHFYYLKEYSHTPPPEATDSTNRYITHYSQASA